MHLPEPITITDMYLAAILAELTRLNETMDRLTQRVSSAGVVAPPVSTDSAAAITPSRKRSTERTQ